MHLRTLPASALMPRMVWPLAALLLFAAVDAKALPLVIVSASLDPAVAGVAYADTLAADSGSTPYAWELAEGLLPTGLALDPGSGEIAGTATAAGSHSFVARVTDALGDTASRAFTLTLLPGAPADLSFLVQPSDAVAGAALSPAVEVKVSDAFGNGVVGEAVQLALGGPGTLSGTTLATSDSSGVASFATLSVAEAGPHQLAATSGALTPANSATFTISAGPAASLAFAVQPSDAVASTTIFPAVELLVSDALGNPVPAATVSLALGGTGALSGGAPQLSDTSGIARFDALSIDVPGLKVLQAFADSIGPVVSDSFAIQCPVLTLGSARRPDALRGVAHADTLIASGGTAPYRFSITSGALPAGLAMDSSGVISGTPVALGSSVFTVTVTDAHLCDGAQSDTLAVVCAPIALVPASLPDLQRNVPHSDSLAATGGAAPYTFAVTAGSLPAGLVLSAGGALTGTPTVAGPVAFTVTATDTVGCTGSRAYAFTVVGVPAPVSDLAVARTTSGNDADGTLRLAITFTPSTYAASAEVYRAPFGGYPRYDDAGGLTPPTPSYPPGSPWVLTPVTASGQTDEPATRDAYAYVVFLKNAFGQTSAVSNKTAAAPNYALGDVSNGFVAGQGDNQVTDLDISLLGAHYGISGATIVTDSVSYLDVGPTVDFGMGSRPFTDGRIDFEDLIVFATNYGEVSAPAFRVASADAAARAARAPESFVIEAPDAVAEGSTFEVRLALEAHGRIQGLSGALAWDASVCEPLSMQSGGWLEGQRGVLWGAGPGAFDGALLGARPSGLSGAGTIATFAFRAKRSGAPAIRLAHVLARDAANRTLGPEALALAGGPAVPDRTALLAPSPNPAAGASLIAFDLAKPGTVELAIYSVDGRRVRTLAQGAFAAGTHRLTWDGRDDVHHRVAPGVYFARLVAPDRTQSKMLIQIQ